MRTKTRISGHSCEEHESLTLGAALAHSAASSLILDTRDVTKAWAPSKMHSFRSFQQPRCSIKQTPSSIQFTYKNQMRPLAFLYNCTQGSKIVHLTLCCGIIFSPSLRHFLWSLWGQWLYQFPSMVNLQEISWMREIATCDRSWIREGETYFF